MVQRKYKQDPQGNIVWRTWFEEGVAMNTQNEMSVPSAGTPMKMHFEPVYEDEIPNPSWVGYRYEPESNSVTKTLYQVTCIYCRQVQWLDSECKYCGAPIRV